eukprot:CAMPEP_0170538656 /NCGR_PEP_ID=MMETSP0209-20121228/103451_1 /TAXON_ID=665100 ORGANISM="Litonotus pictus, Strain P1" /NCGR_SAMPLE_ID=MMETSP0209 /ASSEMBLY_ACC=CAM_ASM_000301 /LENGTH=437 /DNA_ID=CAMNT_0010840407 /DNA_START=230 /DNA_END=1543 /DNA_ORIENTATION=+
MTYFLYEKCSSKAWYSYSNRVLESYINQMNYGTRNYLDLLYQLSIQELLKLSVNKSSSREESSSFVPYSPNKSPLMDNKNFDGKEAQQSLLGRKIRKSGSKDTKAVNKNEETFSIASLDNNAMPIYSDLSNQQDQIPVPHPFISQHTPKNSMSIKFLEIFKLYNVKRENIDKTVIRRYIKYLKNYFRRKELVRLRLSPGSSQTKEKQSLNMSTFLPSLNPQKHQFKSFNNSYLHWFFSHSTFDLHYSRFIQSPIGKDMAEQILCKNEVEQESTLQISRLKVNLIYYIQHMNEIYSASNVDENNLHSGNNSESKGNPNLVIFRIQKKMRNKNSIDADTSIYTEKESKSTKENIDQERNRASIDNKNSGSHSFEVLNRNEKKIADNSNEEQNRHLSSSEIPESKPNSASNSRKKQLPKEDDKQKLLNSQMEINNITAKK